MFIIAGLGNPSKEYDKTRHNAGFDTVDYLADRHGIYMGEKKHINILQKYFPLLLLCMIMRGNVPALLCDAWVLFNRH